MTKTEYEKELERKIRNRKNHKGCGAELQRGGFCSKNHLCTGCIAYKEEVYDLGMKLKAYKQGKQEEREKMKKLKEEIKLEIGVSFLATLVEKKFKEYGIGDGEKKNE